MLNLTPDPDEARTLLGVSSDDHETEVLRVYRHKASQWHPDKNPDPRAAEMFDRITRARAVLLEELRSPRTGPTTPAPPPNRNWNPEDPLKATPTAGESAWVPNAGPQAPPDPWGQGSTHATRPPQSGGYQYPFSGSPPSPSYRAYSAPPQRGRGSTITALITSSLMLMSCCFVFALPSVVLATMALSQPRDHEKAVRYERYAWISIGINLVGLVVVGFVTLSGGA